jgi:hypothetical protein
MAKQTGNIIIVGTIDGITFYKMDCKGFARRKSSLTRKRVKKDPRFARTMESAHRFGKGNRMASNIYRSLPREERVYGLFKELKRIAILRIKEGKSEEEVMRLLRQHLGKTGNGTQQGVAAQVPAGQKAVPPLCRTPKPFRALHEKSAAEGNSKAQWGKRQRKQRWVRRCRQRKRKQKQTAIGKPLCF